MKWLKGLSAALAATGAVMTGSAANAGDRSWSGLYIGANLGGAWSDGNASYSQSSGAGAFSANLDDSSVIGGGHVGYNWQSGSIIVGLEADIAAQNLSSSVAAFPFGGATDRVTLSEESKWVGTLRPKLGFLVGPDLLLYATGGLAFGKVERSYEENRITVAGAVRTFTDSSTRTGWTIGGGGEWAIGNQWRLGVEYLHIDLGGSTTITGQSTTAGDVLFPTSSASFGDFKEDIVRARLSFKLGREERRVESLK